MNLMNYYLTNSSSSRLPSPLTSRALKISSACSKAGSLGSPCHTDWIYGESNTRFPSGICQQIKLEIPSEFEVAQKFTTQKSYCVGTDGMGPILKTVTRRLLEHLWPYSIFLTCARYLHVVKSCNNFKHLIEFNVSGLISVKQPERLRPL